MAICLIRKALAAKMHPTQTDKTLFRRRPGTTKKNAMFDTLKKGTSVIKEKVRTKTTGLAIRT
jgi:hypothetical protein